MGRVMEFARVFPSHSVIAGSNSHDSMLPHRSVMGTHRPLARQTANPPQLRRKQNRER